MKYLLGILFLVYGTSTFAAPTCGFYWLNMRTEPAQWILLENSELVLPVDEKGAIVHGWHRKEVKIRDGVTLVYVIDEFKKRANGCHHIYTSTGIVEDQDTWVNTFNDWCEDSTLSIHMKAIYPYSFRCNF